MPDLETAAPESSISENESEIVTQVTDGAPDTPEVVETEEEANERVKQESEKAAGQREEKRRQTFQSRINEVTRDRNEAQKMASQLAEQNARILALLEGKAPAATQATGGEPKRDQFTEYEDFVTARAEYRAEQKAQAVIESFRREQEQTQSKRTQETEQGAAERQFETRRNELAKTLPDFKDVVRDWEPKLPGSVVDMILRMPDGPLIGYHMAKNPELEAKFNDQPAFMHGIILGQLSQTLKSSAKTVSTAPAPGKPVGGMSAPQTGDYTGSPEGYTAWAKKHMK
jgi:hypothetical protein